MGSDSGSCTAPAMASGGTLGFMQIVLGCALGRVLLAAVVVPYYFKNEI